MEDTKKEIYKKIQKVLTDESKQFNHDLDNIVESLKEFELKSIKNKD